MRFINHMEANLLYPMTKLDKTENDQGTLKFFLNNIVDTNNINTMAIKENQGAQNKCVYSVPVKPSNFSYMNVRSKSIKDAKNAFLNSTINSNAEIPRNPYKLNKKEDILHYAQIAVTTNSEDTRSTGGGKDNASINTDKGKIQKSMSSIKKNIDLQQRKVSFKIKTTSSYRRPPLATKTMTITSNKVSELTKKFNNLIQESHGAIKPSKLVKTIEDLQTTSQRSGSNSSTPSSTLSSSPNIKIVFRHRRGSKKRPHRKRCSSVDSIDKIKNSTEKTHVIRSKSDNSKKTKSPKKRLRYQDAIVSNVGSDCVDGIVPERNEKSDCRISNSNVVKEVIKKFECEINSKPHDTSTIKRTLSPSKNTNDIVRNEKPKVPEKKVSLLLTKNVVVKDGVAKIKTIKPCNNESQKGDVNIRSDDLVAKKKEPIYDKKKFKTSYIHSEKLSLHVVDIIHEDINENNNTPSSHLIKDSCLIKQEEEEKIYQDINSRITPNESFLWRRKSSTQIYSDSERSTSDGPYSLLNISAISTLSDSNAGDVIAQDLYNDSVEITQPPVIEPKGEEDFESNLIEAYNKDVMIGFTEKPIKKEVIEDDYEPLEPIQCMGEVTVTTNKSAYSEKQSFKLNCPLPEIPKDIHKESPTDSKENIYQCLLEMRSHPEGDESSHHSYESYERKCENDMEERTRGDGDSDNGYEYCKNPIKPYCQMSSAGLQIADEYQPHKGNDKNYAISKSVSGTSTVSYEKIGSERIYERIPPRPDKPKNTSPTSYSNRHSFVSSDYTHYNDGENIYDTIKHADGVSLSHCYESIPNSPSLVKLRNNFRKQLAAAVQKRFSFDQESTISQSTVSSEQKTNSIYGQRSMLSYNGQEITFPIANSDSSTSDRSDRSDDWVDVSDEEKYDEQKIIIVRERSRGRKSPISWSQKVRDQWHNTPMQSEGDNESGHLYESLEPAPAPVDDFDSFDSDTDTDEPDIKSEPPSPPVGVTRAQLPPPPLAGGGGPYTLTKIASAAQRKMRELKRNLTKKYSVAVDGKAFNKSSPQTNGDSKPLPKSPIYANCDKHQPVNSQVYGNMTYPHLKPAPSIPYKTEMSTPKVNGFKDELRAVVNEKRLNTSNGDVPPVLPEKLPLETPSTPTSEQKGKDSGTLSRKTYFSFKSRFRRANSLAVDISSDVPSALKITNSTFYLTDSMDGDSGFSNCSDNAEAPTRPARRDGTRARRAARGWSESTPCLALARPALPPPPPPPPAPPHPPSPALPTHHAEIGAVNEELKRLLPSLSRKERAPRTRTSWYAECGADVAPPDTPPSATRSSSTSWYAEAGLYQAGNISSSSGASSGSHPASPLPHSLFTHEPLYQFYNAAKVESVCRESVGSDSETYEEARGSSGEAAAAARGSSGASEAGETRCAGARPSAMALVTPARGPARTLWCEVPEVVNSAVLSSLAPAQKRLQEAKFELLTSEASYLNSLNVLETHFISHPAFRDPHLLSRADRDMLFSTILPVRRCSQLLMNELERCWQENILLQGVCDVVRLHAARHFHVYVRYCAGQAAMVRALQRLRDRPRFAAALRAVESHSACQSLSLHSFLMLPMQRVTRLPLLMDAVLRNLNEADEEYQSCMDALATLNNFVSECNEGARTSERMEEMYRLSQAIEFPERARHPPDLGPSCARRDRRLVRWLVRSGEMTQMVWKTEDQLKLTFGKKFHKIPLHVFLFNDLLVITKKKGEHSYMAVDWCLRSLVEVCGGDAAAGGGKHALLLTLLENHVGRTLEMVVSCPSATDAARWEEALGAAGGAGAAGAEGEAVYAGWDCPQVAALYPYCALQPDELALTEGDVLNVTRKTPEGWYYGERLRDGEAGWFPGAYTAEVASPHVRARNLRQRYRLLALSATYLGQRRKPVA